MPTKKQAVTIIVEFEVQSRIEYARPDILNSPIRWSVRFWRTGHGSKTLLLEGSHVEVAEVVDKVLKAAKDAAPAIYTEIEVPDLGVLRTAAYEGYLRAIKGLGVSVASTLFG